MTYACRATNRCVSVYKCFVVSLFFGSFIVVVHGNTIFRVIIPFYRSSYLLHISLNGLAIYSLCLLYNSSKDYYYFCYSCVVHSATHRPRSFASVDLKKKKKKQQQRQQQKYKLVVVVIVAAPITRNGYHSVRMPHWCVLMPVCDIVSLHFKIEYKTISRFYLFYIKWKYVVQTSVCGCAKM